jgi:hypothetical protein
MAKTAVVRILSITLVESTKYQPNQLVSGIDEKTAETLEKQGMVSTKEADIKYCKDVLKSEVIEHGKASEAKPAANPDSKPAPAPKAK